MTVPFSPMAPGIKARAVLQVIGRRDSMLNPTGIRYLPLDDQPWNETLGLRPPMLSDIAAATSGIQLLVSHGTLALSAATLAEVRKVSAKLDLLLAEQKATQKRLADIVQQLESISLKVSEGRLATIADHAIRSAMHSADEISFVPFVDLAHDLEGFMEDAGIIRGLPVALRLGSDLRGSLRRICQLLQGVRLHIARFANENATRTGVSCECHTDKDYWSDLDQTSVFYEDVGMIRQMETFNRASSRAHRAIDSRFRMNNAQDHEALQASMNDALIGALVDAGVAASKASETIKAVRSGFPELDKPDAIPYLDRDFHERYGNALLDAVRETAARARTAGYYPRAAINAAMQSKLDANAALDEWRTWWLYQTDIGLVYRTFRECKGVRDGYARAFESMSALDASTLRSGIDAPVGLLESGVPPIRVELDGSEAVLSKSR